MTSNDTTNQSTAPAHIGDAIAARTAEIESWHDAGNPKSKGQQIEAAMAVGCREALRDVVRGEIITDDKQRADRMTRTLVAVLREDEDKWTDEERQVVAEAYAWAEVNPELVA